MNIEVASEWVKEEADEEEGKDQQMNSNRKERRVGRRGIRAEDELRNLGKTLQTSPEKTQISTVGIGGHVPRQNRALNTCCADV